MWQRLRNVEDWAKSAHAQVGTFSHGRGPTASFLSRGEEIAREFEEFMLRRRGAELTAVLILLLVLCANYLRGRAACRRAKRSGRRL